MKSIEIARRLAELNETNEAQKAYILALSQEGLSPEEELEGASYLFFSEADYKLPFTHFVSLFNRGCFQAEILDLMAQAFYLPNVKKQQKQYEKNVNALSDYPYLFRKAFPAFDELPILFFPFDNNGYVPYFPEEKHFGEYVDLDDPIIDRWFFKDLSKPILADDVYSQYQLEYLNDNVRKSEWVAKENHIYLHYTIWERFCAYLPVLNFKKLLNDQKIVFLIEDEVSRYPIDFKAEYDIDYTEYPVKPIGVREINKLIWHTQLSSHNGGDFFNEIFYDHPNLIIYESAMFESIQDSVKEIRHLVEKARADALRGKTLSVSRAVAELMRMKAPSDKDYLVALFLNNHETVSIGQNDERIVPAFFFQPHFHNIVYQADMQGGKGRSTTLFSEQYEAIRRSPLFKGFKYIKTFTPLRRPSTSYASTIRFMLDDPTTTEEERAERLSKEGGYAMHDPLELRLLNRSFMVNDWDRLYHDSRLVRFEDGKLNPKATFTALAEFLDIPYTESMTYCSGKTGVNPESLKGNDLGFSTAAIYRTYPEWANDTERMLIEYFFRDVYETYGYDFQYYGGEPVDEAWIEDKLHHCDCLDGLLRREWTSYLKRLLSTMKDTNMVKMGETPKQTEDSIKKSVDELLEKMSLSRKSYFTALQKGLRFVNKEGQPLRMMTPLKLDPELLEQPLYH